jgi:site-specific DNA-methyltransferase (adenine-specific)/modification methylase
LGPLNVHWTSDLASALFEGDCLEVLRRHVADETVHLVIADDPYGISRSSFEWKRKSYRRVNEDWDKLGPTEREQFTRAWVAESHRVLVGSGSIYACASFHHLDLLMATIKETGFAINNVIAWEKPNRMPNKTARTYTHAIEFIVWAVKGRGWTYEHKELKRINPDRCVDGSPKAMSDIWRVPSCRPPERLRGPDGKAAHPTQKPEKLIERMIRASSRPGELVVDPFFGSGTTGAVARRLGRRWIGVERDKRYVELALVRLGMI